ncbi:putative extensin-like [Iris pallida]|uniref:Extensin-like n=1 Tax=Iris pallida TaxID=29817 RepID=A0AAX6G5F0_IRIPA|nr:putative extensin-like [Iris pallida]
MDDGARLGGLLVRGRSPSYGAAAPLARSGGKSGDELPSSTILGVGDAGDWQSRCEGGSAEWDGGRTRNHRRGTLEGLGSRAHRLVWSNGSRRRQGRRR